MALTLNGTTGISGIDGSASAAAIRGSDSNTGISFGTDIVNINTGGTTRAYFDSSGDIRFGTVDASIFNEKFRFFTSSSEPVLNIDLNNTGTASAVVLRHARGGLAGFTGTAFSFVGNDRTQEGSIVIGTTATSYNTSSDYRLKENEVAISDGITRLKQLKPYQFNFKKDPTVKVDGFFAHEVSSIVPNAVTGEKDAVKEDGSIEPQGIDPSKLVPLLTAALQEAVAKIETLETKVAALEAA